MDRWWSDGTERGAVLWKGVLAIVTTGALLGIAQNALVRMGSPKDGLAWKYAPVELPTLDSVAAQAGGQPADGHPAGAATPIADPGNDPLGLAAAGSDIPDIGRPIQVQISKVKELVDANAAVVVDARDAGEYAEGHIPGAVNLPYDDVVTDPARLESFDPHGKPIVVYCGGGTCELSMNLGFALVNAGKKKVLVYTGGWPEWSSSGNAIAKGPTPGGAS